MSKKSPIDLTGKCVLVTGGSRGIGRAISKRMAEQGAQVCFNFLRNREAAAEATSATEKASAKAVAATAKASAKAVTATEKASAKDSRPTRRIVPSASAATSSGDEEVLIVASRLKNYIRETSGFNTSDGVLEPLSVIVRKVCQDAIRNAERDGRKTVLDRDVPKS